MTTQVNAIICCSVHTLLLRFYANPRFKSMGSITHGPKYVTNFHNFRKYVFTHASLSLGSDSNLHGFSCKQSLSDKCLLSVCTYGPFYTIWSRYLCIIKFKFSNIQSFKPMGLNPDTFLRLHNWCKIKNALLHGLKNAAQGNGICVRQNPLT